MGYDSARCSALLAMAPSDVCSALGPLPVLSGRCGWRLLWCAAGIRCADSRASAAAAPCCAAPTVFREACRAAAGALLVTCCTAAHTGGSRQECACAITPL